MLCCRISLVGLMVNNKGPSAVTVLAQPCWIHERAERNGGMSFSAKKRGEHGKQSQNAMPLTPGLFEKNEDVFISSSAIVTLYFSL